MNEKLCLNIIPEKADLVLIALNPTEEAIKNKAVFSTNEAFWNLLQRAGLIEEVSHLPLAKRAVEVFELNNFSSYKLGFADLLPFVKEKNSNKVKVHENAAKELVDVLEIKEVKKIALLGQKVVDSFAREYEGIKSWSQIEIVNGLRQFGKIGEISLKMNTIEVFAVPFPVNNSIKDKYIYYENLLP